MSIVKENYERTIQLLSESAKKYSKPIPQVVIASKKKSPETVEECIAQTGHLHFGENYAAELRAKADWFLQRSSQLPDIHWHFIGQVQTNNLSIIAKYASTVHTVFRLKHAVKLNKLAEKHRKSINVFLQLKVDPSKPSGGTEGEILTLAKEVQKLEHLALQGLMVYPALGFQDQLIKERPPPLYQGVRSFADKIGAKKLSLGTTSDLDMAVSAGTSVVRVGRAILGER